MATFAPERQETLQRSRSDARPFLRLDADWSPLLRDSEFVPQRARSRRQRSKREEDLSRRPFFGNGTYRNLEDHERWDAEYRQANALQPRWYNNRAQSADHRRPNGHISRNKGVLAPEPPPRLEQRPSSDPEIPRFEELTDRFEDLGTVNGTVSEDNSDADEYEAPSTLLGQAQDCMGALTRAAYKAKSLGSDGDQGADPSILEVAHRCEDSLFRLKVWISESKLEEMPAGGDSELDNEVITLASSILYRLHARTSSLAANIDRAARTSPDSFSFAAPAQKDVDDDVSEPETANLPSGVSTTPSGTSSLPIEDLSPAARIGQDSKQMELQIRTLRRLTRSLRIVQKDEFSVAVVKHVAEVTQLFGTKEGCEKWSEEVQGMPADAALRRVREIVGGCA